MSHNHRLQHVAQQGGCNPPHKGRNMLRNLVAACCGTGGFWIRFGGVGVATCCATVAGSVDRARCNKGRSKSFVRFRPMLHPPVKGYLEGGTTPTIHVLLPVSEVVRGWKIGRLISQCEGGSDRLTVVHEGRGDLR